MPPGHEVKDLFSFFSFLFFFPFFLFSGQKTVYKTEKDLFNETISFSYKCKSQPCVLILSNYDAKRSPWGLKSQRLAMVGQTAEWSYSGDTDPFKALCVTEQPKPSKYQLCPPFLSYSCYTVLAGLVFQALKSHRHPGTQPLHEQCIRSKERGTGEGKLNICVWNKTHS